MYMTSLSHKRVTFNSNEGLFYDESCDESLHNKFASVSNFESLFGRTSSKGQYSIVQQQL